MDEIPFADEPEVVEPRSSLGLRCPLGPTLCDAAVCAWWDADLDTCCVRAITDLLHSMYGGGGVK